MNNSQPKSFLHYDPVRVDYSVNKEELESLKNASRNNWKDFAIGCLAVGIPCAINALIDVFEEKPFKITLSFNLNAIAGTLGIVLGAAFLVAWFKTKKNLDKIIQTIKNKPKIEFTPRITNVGKIEERI